jgi:hypothetical protein
LRFSVENRFAGLLLAKKLSLLEELAMTPRWRGRGLAGAGPLLNIGEPWQASNKELLQLVVIW